MLTKRIWLGAVTCGILTAGPARVVWLSDGGPGFWRLFREVFADYAIPVAKAMPAKTYGKRSNLGLIIKGKPLVTIFVKRDDYLRQEKPTPF